MKEKYQKIYSCNRQCIISCKQKDKTVYRKTIGRLANRTISTNTCTIPESSRNKSKQKSEKDVCANYNYETEHTLLCNVRRSRFMGSWPKI